MLCIFCRKEGSFKTVEHIIPESLGNTDHILPRGVVCDACNNYFAVKVEKVLLEMPYFISLRQRNLIRNKKGRLVPDKALFPHPNGGWAEIWIDENGFIFDIEDQEIISLIKSGQINKMIIPMIDQPAANELVISRFLAKVALEMIAFYCAVDGVYTDSFIEENNLDTLRSFARYGKGPFWQYHQRRIYSESDRFMNEDIQPDPYEILHEMDFRHVDTDQIYFVLVIMGIEYTIDLSFPVIDRYLAWLNKHDQLSPIRRGKEFMVPGKNDSASPLSLPFDNK